MLNKKNAAYAVFGFAIVGCNNILVGCNSCKSVPQALEKLTVIFENLKGVTYANLGEYLKKENGKKEILGKDLIDKEFVTSTASFEDELKIFIVNYDEGKNEMRLYIGDDNILKNECKGEKKYKLISIKFEEAGTSVGNITKDTKCKVASVNIGNDLTTPKA